MAKFTFLVLLTVVALAATQNIRPYKPIPSLTVLSSRANEGRYNPNNDGRYVPDNSGRYSGNDGRYIPDGSGKYSGQNYQYEGDNSGRYSAQNDKYKGDNSGRYSAQNDKYEGDNSGRYSGQNDKFKGVGGSGKFEGSAGLGVGSLLTKASPSLLGRPTSNKVDLPHSAPVAHALGSASGKYDNRHYAIIRQEATIEEDGYHYLYETENGITGEEQGKLHNRNTDEESMHAHGFYTYTGPDNVIYTVRYTADENGFVPEGDHLPTPPPIPEAIARALEYQRQQGTL